AAPTNVACAVAVAVELGVPFDRLERLLDSLPVVQSRLASYRSEAGFMILDDTYNSNPAGARLALSALAREASDGGRRVVVTPGMVELGSLQEGENAAFAKSAVNVASDLLVVGRTNKRPLLAGARQGLGSGLANVVALGTRQQAVDWVRAHLGPGDVVLYENDLPDHYA
ncbi:MAG: glutamate ligase domain-containing protein, partial [Acidimicrobiales bacterium]